MKSNPVFHVTAITHRRDALFQTFTIGGRNMTQTDTAQVCALRTEAVVSRSLENSVRDVRAVYALPASGGTFNVRVAMQQRVPRRGAKCNRGRVRFSGQRQTRLRGRPRYRRFPRTPKWNGRLPPGSKRIGIWSSDPSSAGLPLDRLWMTASGSRARPDSTSPCRSCPPGAKRSIEHQVPAPPVYDGDRYASLDAALESGPKWFAELMARDRDRGRPGNHPVAGRPRCCPSHYA
ncbi:MAG: hypothetical protein WDN69_32695 [Aliidongia sp.]